jgi:hypothetical protein
MARKRWLETLDHRSFPKAKADGSVTPNAGNDFHLVTIRLVGVAGTFGLKCVSSQLQLSPSWSPMIAHQNQADLRTPLENLKSSWNCFPQINSEKFRDTVMLSRALAS